LIAEEVNLVFPSLSITNPDGSMEGVNYHGVDIVTLKVVQLQEKRIEELENSLSESRNEIEYIKKMLDDNESQLQIVLKEISSMKQQLKKQKK
jgi:hypothetical protein